MIRADWTVVNDLLKQPRYHDTDLSQSVSNNVKFCNPAGLYG